MDTAVHANSDANDVMAILEKVRNNVEPHMRKYYEFRNQSLNEVYNTFLNKVEKIDINLNKSTFNGEVSKEIHHGPNLHAPYWNLVEPFFPKRFRDSPSYYAIEKSGMQQWVSREEAERMLDSKEIREDHIISYSPYSFADITEIDKCKMHWTILMEREDNLPIYSIKDDIREYTPADGDLKCGRYYYTRPIFQFGSDKDPLPAHIWIDSEVLNYFISVGAAEKKYIRWELLPSRELDIEMIQNMITFLYNGCGLDDKLMKNLINVVIGMWGKCQTTSADGFLSVSDDTARRVQDFEKYIPVAEHEGLKLYVKEEKSALYRTHRPFYQAVIDSEYMMNDKTRRKICKEGTIICYVKTDAIGVINAEHM
jgi:hypothetical protein